MRGAAVALRWVGDPVTVLAAVVLLANDQVLKLVWPGVVTGKLSDVAGLVAAPALLGLALGLVVPAVPPRAVACGSLAATAVGFGWVKLTDAGAGAASAAWTAVAGPSRVLADPTDLLALPALAVAWWSWRRARDRPAPSDAVVERVRTLVAVPLVVLAVSATSMVDPAAVTVVEEHDGRVVIGGTIAPLISTTGVDGWRRLGGADTPVSASGRNLEPLQQAEACVPGESRHCYRVRGHPAAAARGGREPVGGRLLGVDATTDGGRTWNTAWEIPAGRRPFLERHHGWTSDNRRFLGSVDILVRDVPGGHQVIVANGVDGLAVRDSDGRWRRVAVEVPAASPDEPPVVIRPSPLAGFGRGVGQEMTIGIALTLLALFAASCVVASRLARVRGWRALLWPGVMVTALTVAVFGLSGLLFFSWVPMSALAAVVLAGGLLAVALSQPDLPRLRAVLLAGAALLVGVVFTVPYLGWTIGRPEDHEAATRYAWPLAAAAFLLTLGVAWWAAARPRPPRSTRPAPPAPRRPGPTRLT